MFVAMVTAKLLRKVRLLRDFRRKLEEKIEMV